MRKFIRMAICLLCFTLLAGCDNAYLEVTPNNLDVKTWNPITGYPVPFAKKDMPEIDVQVTQSGEVWVNESRYVPLSYAWNRQDTQYTSGWKIQLDRLYHIGGFLDGQVFSSDCENPPVIFTHSFMGDVALYFRPDIAEKGVAAFSFDEFNIIENNSPYINEEIRIFWNVHTGADNYNTYGLMLGGPNGKREFYSVMLEHKEFPELTYQMKFCIHDKYLIIENINANTIIYTVLKT